MKIRPLNDRILARPVAAVEKTPGGIIIPDTAKEKPMEADVIAVGPGKVWKNGLLEPMHVAEGDKVLYTKYSGTEIELEGEKLLFLVQSDLLAVVR